jgi:hypothetical protein
MSNLEEKCQKPGHWLIEGYKCFRKRTYGRGGVTYWQIFDSDKQLLTEVEYLDDARAYIANLPGVNADNIGR